MMTTKKYLFYKIIKYNVQTSFLKFNFQLLASRLRGAVGRDFAV
jgi:hypothetical protein